MNKSVLNAVSLFVALPSVRNIVKFSDVKKLLTELRNIRHNRFLKLVELSKLCYDFRVYFNSAECKELRKKKKIDVTMEDVISVTFNMGKAYFYRLATMGKYVKNNPEKVGQFITLNAESPTEYVMDATTFNDFCSGKTKDNKETEPKDDDNSSNVTDALESHDRQLEQEQETKENEAKEVVFNMLYKGQGVTISKHNKGGYVTELHNIEPTELQEFLKNVTNVMPTILLDAKRHQPFGVTHYLDTKSKKWITDYGNIKLTKPQRELVTQSIKNHA
jgi:hypothetical protein